MKTPVRIVLLVNCTLLALLGVVVLVYPATRALLNLGDPALRQPGIPRQGWRLAAWLTPRQTAWARLPAGAEAAPSDEAAQAGTSEWPMVGAVLYLWGIENLQAAWDAGDHAGGVEPRAAAREAIVAIAERAAAAVPPAGTNRPGLRGGGGPGLLKQTLVLAALTSRERLLKDGAQTNRLRDEVASVAREIEESRSGLPGDASGRAHPAQVLAAIACVERADTLVGVLTNRALFVDRALRGFTGARATKLGLPPMVAQPQTGRPATDARGGASALMCLFSADLWPTQSRQWFQALDKNFWQEGGTAAGFREHFIGGTSDEWALDPEAGLIARGFGAQGSLLGMGAARKHGRFDRAYPVAAEVVAVAWELPGGFLTVPRLLDPAGAPLLDESALLWVLTIQPDKGTAVKPAGAPPLFPRLIAWGALAFGLLFVVESLWRYRTARNEPEREYPAAAGQALLWAALLGGGVALLWVGETLPGLACLVLTVIFPRSKKHPRDQGNRPEDLPPPREPGPSANTLPAPPAQ